MMLQMNFLYHIYIHVRLSDCAIYGDSHDQCNIVCIVEAHMHTVVEAKLLLLYLALSN